MRFEVFHAAALALPGATFGVKWGADRIYSVGGRMFASAGAEGETSPCYAFKASDLAFEMLVDEGVAVPAPYLARAKWVRLAAADVLTDADLLAYLRRAHGLIAARLTRKARAELGIAEPQA